MDAMFVMGLALVITGICVKGTAASCSPGDYRVVDLSHNLDRNSLSFPFNVSFELSILFRGLEPEGYWFELNKISTLEHMGTHLDAPGHTFKGSWRVHQIPVDRLVGPGVVIDVRAQVAKNSDYRLSVLDIERWERLYGAIPNGAIVFMWSGWDVRYPDKFLTFNSITPGNISTFHFPGFHPDAVRWLLRYRNISMIGVDTPSTDYGQSKNLEVHQLTGGANVMGLENVNNLCQVPPSGATIVVPPMKVFDGSGVPVRILALVDKAGQPSRRCPDCTLGGRRPYPY
ncbi:unnamed protein product [Lymnaea stagnalis]|uniref:Kynurenine formamidase n=1 Tax=Lymnaea stagnalis TaxID=6523 RepID=A0AAV2I3Q6_LYMST